ncbi:MAG TPA: CdaR family protein [Vicinamibacteria bacterium]|nr:CdaR family protein [Vicinamibacteria bacterium]
MTARLTGNLGLKILALLLGFSLWYAVAREQGAEFAFTLPLELRGVPEGFEVVEESAQQVEVRLRGSAELLRRLTTSDIVVTVDLSDAEPGERIAYLTPENVKVPFGARVMRVTPTSIKLELDRTLGRTVEVIPRVLGSPATGFELVDIELTPRHITVVGPASRLKGLEQVTTEPISAEGLREPYSRAVRVELDPLVRLDRDTTVEITLQVGEERLRREVSGIVVAGDPESSSVRLEPQTLRVTLEGPRSLVEALSAEDLVATVPLDGLSSGRHNVAPLVRLRSVYVTQVEVIGIKPEEITVRIP